MTNRNVAALLIAGTLSVAPAAMAADSSNLVHISDTQQAPFRSGGTIYIDHSFGDLWVEGWDQPNVEIVVTKSPDKLYTAKDRGAANAVADNIKVSVNRKSDSELAITTSVGHFSRWRHPFSEIGNVMMEYRIRVPRDSKLVIRHLDGQVLVSNMLGDIDARGRTGDLTVLLPEDGKYAIDATSHVGTVSCDLEGQFHHGLWSNDFSVANPAPAHQVRLRQSIGGIEIKSGAASPQAAATMQ